MSDKTDPKKDTAETEGESSGPKLPPRPAGSKSSLPPPPKLGPRRPTSLGLKTPDVDDDEDVQMLTESAIIETDIDLPRPPPPRKATPKGDTLKGMQAPTPSASQSGGFVRLPTSIRDAMPDDIGLEHDLELDQALADFTAQYDGELAAIGPGESERAARLHLTIGRMLELSGYQEGALRRFNAARMRAPRSVVAIRELRRFARQSGRWNEVLELLSDEAQAVTDNARRAAILEERGRLLR